MASAYDTGPEWEPVDVVLADRGLTRAEELMNTVDEYRWLPFRTVRSVGKPPLNRTTPLPD